jgi:hypothetical protein
MAIEEITFGRTWRSSRPKPIEEGIRSFRWPMNGAKRGYVIHATPTSFLGSQGTAGRLGKPDHELAKYVADVFERDPPIHAHQCAGTHVGKSIGGALTPVITTASGLLPARKARVFTLTVKNSARYVANGFMVANCYAAMYDETLNFSRGFGRGDVVVDRPAPDSIAAILAEDDKDRQKDLRKRRRAPWE